MLAKRKATAMFDSIFVSLLAIVMSLVVCAVIIMLLGHNPIDAYMALIKGSVGDLRAFLITLKKSVPLILSGLAVAVAFRCSVFNIGVEGQLMAGAITAAIAGIYFHLPPVLHILLVVLFALAGGMLSALIPALLKRYFNVSVVISTIMFNYVIQFFVQFLIMGPMKGGTSAQATLPIQETAFLPALLPKPYQMNLGFLFMIGAVIFIQILLKKTTTGYEMKTVGFNAIAAETQGINSAKNMFLALLISGAIAGLAGGIEVSGSLHKVILNFSKGYGFAGIPIALIAQSNPIVIILTGFFFGMMSSGSFLMQASVGVSPDVVGLIKGFVVAFLCTEYFIRYYVQAARRRRAE